MAQRQLTLGTTFDRWAGVLSSPIEGRVVLGPNWFASVMGTGVIALAASILPVEIPGLFVLATVAWILAAVLLLALVVTVGAHWLRHPETVRAITNDPIAIQFFGAPPMALMTVGSATLLVGSHYIGESAAVNIDALLWVVGTLLGLATAVLVPFRLFTQLQVRHDGAFGGWLMPVVPPWCRRRQARSSCPISLRERPGRRSSTCATPFSG